MKPPQLAVRPEDAGLELDEHVPSGDRERYAARSNTEHEPLLSGSEDDGGDAQGEVTTEIKYAFKEHTLGPSKTSRMTRM